MPRKTNNPDGINQYTGKAKQIGRSVAYAADRLLGRTTTTTGRVLGSNRVTASVSQTSPVSNALGIRSDPRLKQNLKKDAQKIATRESQNTRRLAADERNADNLSANRARTQSLATRTSNASQAARDAAGMSIGNRQKSRNLNKAATETGILGRAIGLDTRRRAAAQEASRTADSQLRASVAHANNAKALATQTGAAAAATQSSARSMRRLPKASSSAIVESHRAVSVNDVQDISPPRAKLQLNIPHDVSEAVLDTEDNVRRHLGIAPRSRMRRIKNNINRFLEDI